MSNELTPGTKIWGKGGVTDGNNMTSWTPLVEHHDGMLKRNRNLDSKIVALGDGMEMKLIMQALNRGILLRGGEGWGGEIQASELTV